MLTTTRVREGLGGHSCRARLCSRAAGGWLCGRAQAQECCQGGRWCSRPRRLALRHRGQCDMAGKTATIHVFAPVVSWSVAATKKASTNLPTLGCMGLFTAWAAPRSLA